MKTISHSIFSIALICSLLLSACAAAQPAATGPAMALGAGETIRGMQAALAAQPGTFILQNGETWLMAWPRGGQYAFTLIAQGKQVDWNGLRLDTTQMSAMVKSLEQGGWKYTGPAGLPPAVAKALGAYSIEAVMLGVQSLPSVLMVPVIMDFTIPPFEPEGVIQ